ncbi:MAG: hypothetical protein JRF65_08280 [Deltaproteobacteria bacterium]|nr:hypothetical protein [Deltaproteobacteria bacterium]
MNAKNVRNFHVPLPHDLYDQLRSEAERSNTPATVLVRRAITFWLQQRKKAALHHAIAEYAAEYAGTEDDLDADLENASTARLLSELENGL